MAGLEKAYALLIGVGDEKLDTLTDAMAVAEILKDRTLAGYNPDNVILLTGKEATRKRILESFDQLKSLTDEDSSVFLYYSGHGGYGLDSYFIQPYGMYEGMSEDEAKEAWVSAKELKEKISGLASKRLIFFLDCCHAEGMTHGVGNSNPSTLISSKSGVLMKGGEGSFKNADGLASKIDDERGMAIISSCRGDQRSWQLDGEISFFTQCLVEALKGQHKKYFEEPYIRISEVSGYLQREVPKRVKKHKLEQNPYVNLQQYDDFALSYVPEKVRKQFGITESEETNLPPNKKLSEVVTSFRETASATNLLLFVHGFSGEAADTFGNIPILLAAEEKMEGWDMKPLGYSQNVTPEHGKDIWAGVDDIEKISDYMTTSITYKFDKYDRVAIVAHSLGGLIAQRAILNLKKEARNKVSHLILIGTPSGGIDEKFLKQTENLGKYEGMSGKGSFITGLRKDWSSEFDGDFPFKLKVAHSRSDDSVTAESCLMTFEEEYREAISGSHLGMVKPEDRNNDCYNLILSTLTNTEFYNLYMDKEEINLTLGKYEVVKKNLLPKANELDPNGLKKLVFSMEGLDEFQEVLKILRGHPLSKVNTDVMGLLAGRLKRKYLKEFNLKDAEEAMGIYSKALDMAESEQNFNQVYYHAINLAFLSLVAGGNESKMIDYAKISLEAADKCRNNLWKYATIAEANMYLDNMDKAREYYAKAADLSEIREKLSTYTNAYAGYCRLMGVSEIDDEFVEFLREKFLA